MSHPAPFDYPATRRDDVVDDYHGTAVPDPYRWLEDPEAPETQAWVDAQNELTFSYLDELPQRAWLTERLTELWNYPRQGVPIRRDGDNGPVYFFNRNDGLQNQPVLYRQLAEDHAAPLLDPNALSEDGTIALNTWSVDPNGRRLAYGLSDGGSDWQTVRVRNVDSGADLDDIIRWSKFTNVAWTADGAGFYYGRYPDPDAHPDLPPSTHHRLYFHALGTPQADDPLVYERPDDPNLGFSPFFTDDHTYLLLHVWAGSDVQNRVYYRPADSDGDFIRLLDEADAAYLFAGNVGSRFYFHTDLDAPNGRVIAIDVANPDREHWQVIIPEEAEAVVKFAALVGTHLVVATLRHAHFELHLYDQDGGERTAVALPSLGTIGALSGRQQDREFFFAFESFLQPAAVYRYDLTAPPEAEALSLVHGVEYNNFDARRYETKQVFYPSADGTEVSLFLVHRRGLELDGDNPTLLYGYGGFNVSLTPTFNPARLAWLEKGGVLAVANLRGGGEYGEAWHQAGMLEKKQTVFEDFLAAAEWLVEKDYTRPARLGIMGGSNGGLLVAVAMLQRPSLFGAVLCAVPVTDMLRYHRFTAGRYWTAEYGNAEADPEHFAFLYRYSPIHNVQTGEHYPPTLIVTADTDDRVVPAHAYKFAAALQAADAGANPLLLRVETRAGHGHGKPIAKVIEEQRDIYAFLMATLGLGHS